MCCTTSLLVDECSIIHALLVGVLVLCIHAMAWKKCQACTLPPSVPMPTLRTGLTRRVRSVPTALNQAGREGSEMAVPVPRGHSGSALKGRCGLLKLKT